MEAFVIIFCPRGKVFQVGMDFTESFLFVTVASFHCRLCFKAVGGWNGHYDNQRPGNHHGPFISQLQFLFSAFQNVFYATE